jgi:hypothetical protein
MEKLLFQIDTKYQTLTLKKMTTIDQFISFFVKMFFLQVGVLGLGLAFTFVVPFAIAYVVTILVGPSWVFFLFWEHPKGAYGSMTVGRLAIIFAFNAFVYTIMYHLTKSRRSK